MKRHISVVIDRAKRDIAARLVRQFLEGEISSDELETQWPSNQDDRSLEEIGETVWLFYSDHRPRRMVGKEAASPEERELLNRYAAFLDSDIPYDWPKFRVRVSELGPLVPLTLGLLGPLDRWIKLRNAKVDAQVEAHGDLASWPFTSKQQWLANELSS